MEKHFAAAQMLAPIAQRAMATSSRRDWSLLQNLHQEEVEVDRGLSLERCTVDEQNEALQRSNAPVPNPNDIAIFNEAN
jgi:hypothetical protein